MQISTPLAHSLLERQVTSDEMVSSVEGLVVSLFRWFSTFDLATPAATFWGVAKTLGASGQP